MINLSNNNFYVTQILTLGIASMGHNIAKKSIKKILQNKHSHFVAEYNTNVFKASFGIGIMVMSVLLVLKLNKEKVNDAYKRKNSRLLG